MKTVAMFVFFIALLSTPVFAQIPVTITSNTDPGTIVDRIAEAQRYAQTIQNALQQLQRLDQALQYQIMAAQQLSTGTWDGFVKAWNAETGAITNYSNLMAQMPSLSQIQAVSDYVNSDGYKSQMASIQQLRQQWGLASNIVHTTDNVVQNTAARQQAWESSLAQSANNPGIVGQLQLVNQGLGLMGGEVRDLNVNMGAWKTYFIAQIEQQRLEDQITEQQTNDFVTGDLMKDFPLDPGSTGTLDAQYTGVAD